MRRVLVLPLAAMLCAMQSADAPLAPAPPVFDVWLGAFAARAGAAGIGDATIARELAGLAPDPRVIARDRAQPDRAAGAAGAPAPDAFARYLVRHVTPPRIAAGRSRAAMLPLASAQARTGVPARIVLAIWGLETDYGAFTGGFDTVRSLATLAYDGRRAALFEGELIAALRLIDRGLVSRERLRGSWAGATGQPQFLPSSYDRFAVDGDGDGRADIWGSDADTVASIAHYLQANGWRADGAGWGVAVAVPPALDRARIRALTPPTSCVRPLAQHSRWLTVAEWRALGLVPLGAPWPADATYATLVEPDGAGRGAWLTYGGYRALLAYNCSNYYALSVAVLADALAAPPPLPAPAPAGAMPPLAPAPAL